MMDNQKIDAGSHSFLEGHYAGIYGSTNFFATDGRNIIATDVNNTERQTIPTAVEDVAGRGVSLLTEGW
jgi:hypothetical protein